MKPEKQQALLQILDHTTQKNDPNAIFQNLGNFLETADQDLGSIPRIIERRLAQLESHLRQLSPLLWKEYQQECGEKVRIILANKRRSCGDSLEE